MEKDLKKIRIFICIDFPNNIIKEVARIQNIIKKNLKFAGKFTELENLHLTLKFLGEISNELLLKVKERLSKINLPILNLRLQKIGTFSHKTNPRIIWVRIMGKNLIELQKQIDNSLKNLFPLEKRFMSHVTITRIKFTKSPEILKKYISNIKPQKIKFQVKEFKLKSSTLKEQGPIYKTLKEYGLKK
jgi:RNA 2',3'-cyclic 3'-phosphodiesterase